MNRVSGLLLALAALFAGIGFGLVFVESDQPGYSPKDTSSIVFRDLHGQPKTLEDWAGKVRLVNFWATWCAPCREEMPLFQRYYERHKDRDFRVVGIAIDRPDAVEAFGRELDISYPLVVAEPGLATAYMKENGNPSGAVPHSILLSRSGEVLDTRLGPLDETLLKDWIDRHVL